MPFESVTIHETYELLTPIGTCWRKIEAVYKIGEGEDEYIARDKAKAFLDESHQKYFPELSSPPFPSGGQKQKPKMDMVVLKKYQDAMKNNDTKTIQEIENNYHVIA